MGGYVNWFSYHGKQYWDSSKNWNRTTIWSRNFTPGYISEEKKNTNLKRYMYPNVHSSIIYNSQDMEATEVSINRWMDKEDVIYLDLDLDLYLYHLSIYLSIYLSNEILLSHKKMKTCHLQQHGWTWRVLCLLK